MSTLNVSTIIPDAGGSNVDLSISGKGTGRPDLQAGFKVGGTAGIPVSELRAGTDGELITWDASGDAATVAVGTATHVLTSNGAGAAPTFQAAAGGGAWTFIATVTASSSASLTVTGLDSTYDTFAVAVSDLIPATDSTHVMMRVGDSSGVDSGSTDYSNHTGMSTSTSAGYAGSATAGNDRINLGISVGNVSGEGFGGLYYIHNPGDGSVFPLITGTSVYKTYSGVLEGGALAATRDAVITLDRVQILMSSGNITSGRVTAWGIKHA